MMRIKDEVREQIVALYNAGRSVAEIVRESGVNSTGTIYRILNDANAVRPKKERAATYQVLVTLPADLREYVEKQKDFSKLVAKLLYSRIEGGRKKPRIADTGVETKSAYSETEGTPKERNSVDKPAYSESGGQSAEREWDAFHPIIDDSSDIADLTVSFCRDCAPIHTITISTYIDEDIVAKLIVGYSQTEGLQDIDEIEVHNGGQLLWLWRPVYENGRIEKLTV